MFTIVAQTYLVKISVSPIATQVEKEYGEPAIKEYLSLKTFKEHGSPSIYQTFYSLRQETLNPLTTIGHWYGLYKKQINSL